MKSCMGWGRWRDVHRLSAFSPHFGGRCRAVPFSRGSESLPNSSSHSLPRCRYFYSTGNCVGYADAKSLLAGGRAESGAERRRRAAPGRLGFFLRGFCSSLLLPSLGGPERCYPLGGLQEPRAEGERETRDGGEDIPWAFVPRNRGNAQRHSCRFSRRFSLSVSLSLPAFFSRALSCVPFLFLLDSLSLSRSRPSLRSEGAPRFKPTLMAGVPKAVEQCRACARLPGSFKQVWETIKKGGYLDWGFGAFVSMQCTSLQVGKKQIRCGCDTRLPTALRP